MSKLLDGLPECFVKKILVDSFMEQERKKEIVDFEEYKKLRKQQTLIRNQCANYKK